MPHDPVQPAASATITGGRAGRFRMSSTETIVAIIAAVMVIGLFGRIMTFPLGHDEEIHVAAARLIFRQPLYGSLGYNHLPGLPLLLGGVYRAFAADHLLLWGRLLIFACWLATGVLFAAIGRRLHGHARIGLVCAAVLAAGLLGPTGMLVTNNFLPIPFALLGMWWLIEGLSGPEPRIPRLVAAGAAAGFAVSLKISFVFLLPAIVFGALTIPRGVRWAPWIGRVGLPLLIGGLIGCLPAIVVLATGPEMLLAHTLRYFTDAHYAYWQHSDAPKAMSFAAKVLVAQDVWLSGSGLLAGLLVVGAAILFWRQRGSTEPWVAVTMTVALAILFGAIGAFAPAPAFPQYYEPPLPFALLLFMLIYRWLSHTAREALDMVGYGSAAMALAICSLQILPSVPVALMPARWTGVSVHQSGERLRAELAARRLQGAVASLAPIVPLEAGLPIYPEFGAGPFVYRVADYIRAGDRPYFRTTSDTDLPAFLDARRPAAIVTGTEPDLDPAFASYARSHGYAAVPLGRMPVTGFFRPVP
jgi:hypothetical protein